MFQCDYCTAQFSEHQTTCPKCGALIKVVSGREQTPPITSAHALRDICIRYDGTSRLYLDDTLTPKRLVVVRERMNIPAEEVVLMVYDDTLFGNNRLGFAICHGGLYWRNDWAVSTRRKFLPWPEFAQRTIVLEGLIVNLGRGDQIGLAGMGDDNARKQVAALLNEIKTFFQQRS
jgi:hypothetical protein